MNTQRNLLSAVWQQCRGERGLVEVGNYFGGKDKLSKRGFESVWGLNKRNVLWGVMSGISE